MKRYVKWGGIVLASPILLFIIICILLYIPPIQNFIVGKATQYAAEATGMNIQIRRISLSFPLDLVVHDTKVTENNDTILNVSKLTVQIQMLPLFKKQVEIDGIKIEKAAVNTLNLIEGMQLKGNLGELFLDSHGVKLTPETAVLNNLKLKDTQLAMVLADTTAADTAAASSPLYWKIRLEDISLENVSFLMQMPLDTMDMGFDIGKASLRDGFIDLHKEAYTAEEFNLQQTKITYNSGNAPHENKGLDPSHIELTDINIGLDSICYAGNNIRALIRQFDLKERSGLQIVSTQGELRADNQAIHVPSLQINTANSSLEFNATADWSVTEQNKDGKLSARLMADIGKADLIKAVPDLPQEVTNALPSAPIQLRLGIDGSLDELRLTTCSMGIPGNFRLEANGVLHHMLDSIAREGGISLTGKFIQMSFLEKLTGGVTIPSGTILKGKAELKGNALSADTRIEQEEGLLELKGKFNMKSEAYAASVLANNLNIHNFMPNDSIFELTASVAAEGEKFDFFSPATVMRANASLDHLRYGSRVFSGIGLDAELKHSEAALHFNAKDNLMHISSELNARINPKRISAKGTVNVLNLDWHGLGFTSAPFKTTQDIELSAATDMKKSHSARVSMKNIHLITDKKTFTTKDLHVGGTTARDSIHCYANAGDLTFLFRSKGGIDELASQAQNAINMLNAQWETRKFNFDELKQVLPTAQLRIFAGHDNPVSNTLAIRKLSFNKLRVNLKTDPQAGLNGNAYLLGLHTDSLSLDTIRFNAAQEHNGLTFKSEVKAGDKPYQEAFDITLQSRVDSTHANVNIGYFNGKKECGVDLGMTAGLQKEGISLHIMPLDPTLVYRKFFVNEDNYILLRDDGRIMANLSIYDKDHTGLSLYSTPDSLAAQNLTLGINRLDIAEFRRIIPYMPDIAGIINLEAHYVQTDQSDLIAVETSINNLAYSKQPMGNWALSAVYLPKQSGVQSIDGFITRNDEEIASLSGSYYPARGKEETDKIDAKMELHHLPLDIANSFVPGRTAVLSGDLDGGLSVKGDVSAPLINGTINLDSVNVFVPQASLNLRFDDRPLEIKDSKLIFNRFKIFTKGKTPFTIDGNVNMADMANIQMNLKMDANNFELLNAKKTKESLVYGKLYVDFHSVLSGTPNLMMIRGNMNIRGGSDFTYILKDSPLTVEDKLGETVTFVNFNDTASVSPESLQMITLGGIDMLMTLHIDEGVQCRVNLDEQGSNYMRFEGGGDLSFQYTMEGNMILSGRYTLLSGEMKYELPIIPLKTFHIKEGSYIEWTGDLMNPNLNIKATERMRASVAQEGQNARTVNFDVGVDITNRLDNLGFTFTIDAPEDGSVQNDLASMSAEEKNKLAVTMLVTGMYMAEGNTAGGGLDANSVMNSFLQDQINKVAGSALKTIDVNFGIEQTDDGETGSTRTDYNFEFAKRFWNNRIRVVIGGKVSTGNNVQQQDESFIDNISLEYRLDDSGTRYIKVFHDKTYENILDGEVTETGAGIVLRKKVGKLGELFIFRKKRKNDKPTSAEENEETEL